MKDEHGTKERVVVIGTGAMGPGIAQLFALGGHPVTLVGRSPESVARGVRQIESYWPTLRQAGLVNEEDVARALITAGTDLAAACRNADLVIEAIAEDLEAKQALFREVSALVPEEAILASTTSALSATAIAQAVTHPERYINTHFAQPAQLVLIVEVVPGEKTSPHVTRRTLDLLKGIGRVPVVSADTPGFIWSRLQAAVLREVLAMVEQGVASPEDIDKVIKFGYAARLPAMGAFEHADLGGLDLMKSIMETIWPHLDNRTDPNQGLLGEMVASGRLGMKSGRGFYDWTERNPDELRRQRDAEIIRRSRILKEQGYLP